MTFIVGVAVLLWAGGTLGGLYYGMAGSPGVIMKLIGGLGLGAIGFIAGGMAALFSLPFTMLIAAFVSA
jgi:hypothetical protein